MYDIMRILDSMVINILRIQIENIRNIQNAVT